MRAELLQLYLTLCNLMDCGPPGSRPWDSLGKNNRLGCHALPQRIFPTQGLDLCLFYLLHWQAGSLPLASPGKPRFFNLLVALHSMWDLVPQPVMEFMSPALTVHSLHHWATREVPFQMTLTGKEPTCQCRRHKTQAWFLGRSCGGRHGNLLQYSCLENSVDRGAWQAMVHSV